MMVRHSEIQAKRGEMERELNPRQDINDPTEEAVMDEVEKLREVDGVKTRQRASVDANLSRLRRSKRDR